MQDFCFKCLQQWLDIVEAAGGQYIIICDKAVLEKKILKKCRFHNSEIKFMKSYISPFEKILSVLCCKGWVKAGRAHLTTFLHSKQYGLVDFWNIDADDTMFMATPEQTAKIVSTVQKYAKDNDIKAFSLDMHRTRTRGIHWSFGVTYINNSEDWLEIFAKENNSNWNEQYGDLAKYPNVDWYMTYLKDHTDIKIETFYIENTFFMHWSYVALDFPQAFYFYRNRVLYFPLSISSSTPPPRYI